MNPCSPYRVLEVAPTDRIGEEPMGTKSKFWYETGGIQYLFKYSRPGTGEDWAEKAVSEIGARLGVPCAEVELAVCEGERGTATRSFLGEGEVLVHGNELLQTAHAEYPVTRLRKVSEHTVAVVLEVLSSQAPPCGMAAPRLGSAAAWFVGYLLLDALVANTDRHHENWGVVLARGDAQPPQPPQPTLAPSYDHASSLGRELREAELRARLLGRDPKHTVAAYADKARSALYQQAGDRFPLHPIAAFRIAEAMLPEAARAWRERLDTLDDASLAHIFDRLPREHASETARAFARSLLAENRRRLEESARPG